MNTIEREEVADNREIERVEKEEKWKEIWYKAAD